VDSAVGTHGDTFDLFVDIVGYVGGVDEEEGDNGEVEKGYDVLEG
jgi:hypothetical protein